MRNATKVVLMLVLVLSAGVLSSCSGFNDKDVHASSQFYTCIYDYEDGELIDELAPGGGKVNVEDDAEVWRVPTSQRFYNINPDDNVRDPGAPPWVTGVEASYKPVSMVVHAKFYFNQGKACEFIDRHGKRNVPADQFTQDDSEAEQKMGFNVRGDANQPWLRFLSENFGPALQSQGEPLLQRYEWPYYEFNYPVNADLDGVLPCTDGGEADPADPSVVASCNEFADPEPIARDVLEPVYSELFTSELNKQLSGDYFCGPGYDPAKPDVCPPLGIEIVKINLNDRKPVEERERLISLREQAENDAREAELTEDATAAAIASEKSKLEQERQLVELTEQYGGMTPEVAAAKRKAELAAIEAQIEAAKQLAVCQIIGATGKDCALVLAALNGQYPSGDGTVVQVNPDSSAPSDED